MTRSNRIEIATTDAERALLDVAANISHPTAKGNNVARMVRETALSAAEETIHDHIVALVSAGSLDAALELLNQGVGILRMLEGAGEDVDSVRYWLGEILEATGEASPEATMPEDATGIWAWNATHMLIGEGWDLEVVERFDEEE